MVGRQGRPSQSIAGSTVALKWALPLMQLNDWLSNYRLSIIILFFSWGRYFQKRELGMGVRAAALPPYMCGS